MKSIFVVLLFVLGFVTADSFAQESRISFTGKITEKKEGLVGATVKVDGTSCGVATDIDGNYKLSCVVDGAGPYQLKVQFVGYKTAIIEIPNKEAAETKSYNVNYSKPKKYKIATGAL